MIFDVHYRAGPNGLTLFAPDKPEPSPAILLLHGSEGGTSGWTSLEARSLASHGFVTFAYPYSKGGNPWHAGDIVDVELDNTREALEGLRSHDAVQGCKIGLYGVSRGAEHALLLTRLMARDADALGPDAVAVHAPPDTICGGFVSAGYLPVPQIWDPSLRAWQWKGSSEALTPTTPIEVERYPGPLYISHGVKDGVWTVECTRRLERRLLAAGRTPEIHYYEEEGHGFRPAAKNLQTRRLVDFFDRTLRTS